MFRGNKFLVVGKRGFILLYSFILPRFSRISSLFFCFFLSVFHAQYDAFHENENDKQIARTCADVHVRTSRRAIFKIFE